MFLLKTERKQREGALDMQKATVKHLINIIMLVLIAGYFFFTSTQKQENKRGLIVVVDSLLLAVVPSKVATASVARSTDPTLNLCLNKISSPSDTS